MILEHRGKSPRVHESAYVAPTATLCGDVTIGENSCVLFGAVIVAEGGPVEIGASCIIMENAVVRGTGRHPINIGDNVLVGPRAYLTGCTVEGDSFIATGTSIFNGARVGAGSTVRINGVVHVKTVLPDESVVPIGWVAVGDPAEILPPGDHEKIWAVQKRLDFPGTVFGVGRTPTGGMNMPEVARRYTKALGRHRDDGVLDSP